MTNGVRIRLIAFVVLSAVGIVYVAGSFLGIVDKVLGRGYTMHATLPASGGLFTGAEGKKTEEEAALFGGEAGLDYDVNYHAKGDDTNNMAWDAFLINTKAIANSVAKYANSFASLPPVNLKQRRQIGDRVKFTKRTTHAHVHSHSTPCGAGKDKI